MITDAPDTREGGLVEGGVPLGARHKLGALGIFIHQLLGDGASRDWVGDEDGVCPLHHALEVDVSFVARPLPEGDTLSNKLFFETQLSAS